MEADETISVIEAGQRLGRGKATIFKIVARLGIVPRKQRDSTRGNQFVAFLTQAEFQRVKDELVAHPESDEGAEAEIELMLPEYGFFYLIQLEPEHDPLRFKVGFAANLNDRLRALRCSAPFAVFIKSWPCRRLWEKTAIECTTAGCEQLHTEVFRCKSLEAIVTKCNQFFEIMPTIQKSLQFGQEINNTQSPGSG